MPQNITDNRPDGALIGATADEKLGFFGKTPRVQPSGAGQAAVAVSTITTAATSTQPWGFATSTQATDFITTVASMRTLVNQIQSDLVNLGLIKGS